MTVGVYATEQAAKTNFDQLVVDLTEPSETSKGEVMSPSFIWAYITEPEWVETPVTRYYDPAGDASGIGISLRVGRYLGSVEVESPDKSFTNSELLYEKTNQLIAALHELPVIEGFIPIL
jgi:hypothetical protein